MAVSLQALLRLIDALGAVKMQQRAVLSRQRVRAANESVAACECGVMAHRPEQQRRRRVLAILACVSRTLGRIFRSAQCVARSGYPLLCLLTPDF